MCDDSGSMYVCVCNIGMHVRILTPDTYVRCAVKCPVFFTPATSADICWEIWGLFWDWCQHRDIFGTTSKWPDQLHTHTDRLTGQCTPIHLQAGVSLVVSRSTHWLLYHYRPYLRCNPLTSSGLSHGKGQSSSCHKWARFLTWRRHADTPADMGSTCITGLPQIIGQPAWIWYTGCCVGFRCSCTVC